MRSLGQHSRIVAIAGRDEQSSSMLASIGVFQRAIGCKVQVVLVRDGATPRWTSSEIELFCQWVSQRAKLKTSPADVIACGTADIAGRLPEILPPETALVACPGSSDLSSAVNAVPLHAVWSRAAALDAGLLLCMGRLDLRRVLALNDGSPRTLPVADAATALAAHFDVQLSHLNGAQVPALWRSRGVHSDHAELGPNDVGLHTYLRVVHALVAALDRSRGEVSPDLLVVGAAAHDGGGTVSALASSRLPCSLLIAPCNGAALP